MTSPRRLSLCLMLVCSGISLLWGVAVESGAPGGAMGFPGIYYGTRCLIQHCDPYNVTELDAFYRAEGGANQTDTIQRRQSVTLYVNLPKQPSLFVAPFASLPFKLAAPALDDSHRRLFHPCRHPDVEPRHQVCAKRLPVPRLYLSCQC